MEFKRHLQTVLEDFRKLLLSEKAFPIENSWTSTCKHFVQNRRTSQVFKLSKMVYVFKQLEHFWKVGYIEICSKRLLGNAYKKSKNLFSIEMGRRECQTYKIGGETNHLSRSMSSVTKHISQPLSLDISSPISDANLQVMLLSN